MRRLLLPALALLTAALACSRETPAPAPPTPKSATQPAVAPAPVASTVPAAPQQGTYDEAMRWLKSTPGFGFRLQEGTVDAEGSMERPTVGAEKVTFRANGEEWRGEAGPRGLVWSKKSGGTWRAATAPDYAGRLFQRVTIAFDPRKEEGSAQLVSSEGDRNLYRFTNANSGEVHEVSVRKTDARIERMKIGTATELTILP